jgi:hypothetical protein
VKEVFFKEEICKIAGTCMKVGAAAEFLSESRHGQLLNSLKATDKRPGIPINFGSFPLNCNRYYQSFAQCVQIGENQ